MNKVKQQGGLGLVMVVLMAGLLPAQTVPPKQEVRGTWIATVINLDWPTRTRSADQQAELIQMLNRLKATGINLVFFQIRSEADAMYDSPLEPWSHWLTGIQGIAPDPFYDPLAFAIEEAHKRGIELHAWFNPFRAERSIGSYSLSPRHVKRQHPEWMLNIGSISVLNPGIPDVQSHVTNVIMDVVNRYDIDGVHFDDYFYPYPPNQISSQDAETFAEFNRGIEDIGDWRRDNINRLIAQIADSINTVKPDVKFGISPFGIWKNGVPSGVIGLDAHNVIFGDAMAWLAQETVDYVVPQLYWPFGGNQDYARLATWWATQAFNRHLYTGHGLYRSDSRTFGGSLFAANEVPRQVHFNRGDPNIQGSVFFRARNLTEFPSKGFADTLKVHYYRHPALTATMAWKDTTPPDFPQNLTFDWGSDAEVILQWEPPASDTVPVRRYAVYRIQSPALPDFTEAMQDPRNLLGVTGELTWTDIPGAETDPYFYIVTAVSANAVESEPSNEVILNGRAVATRPETPPTFTVDANYPNPFQQQTTFAFTLDRPAAVSLTIHDALGRQVAVVINDEVLAGGRHFVPWTAASGLPGGTYFYTLDVEGHRLTKPMTRLR